MYVCAMESHASTSLGVGFSPHHDRAMEPRHSGFSYSSNQQHTYHTRQRDSGQYSGQGHSTASYCSLQRFPSNGVASSSNSGVPGGLGTLRTAPANRPPSSQAHSSLGSPRSHPAAIREWAGQTQQPHHQHAMPHGNYSTASTRGLPSRGGLGPAGPPPGRGLERLPSRAGQPAPSPSSHGRDSREGYPFQVTITQNDPGWRAMGVGAVTSPSSHAPHEPISQQQHDALSSSGMSLAMSMSGRLGPAWASNAANAYEVDGRPGTRGGGPSYDMEGRPTTRGMQRPPSRAQLGGMAGASAPSHRGSAAAAAAAATPGMSVSSSGSWGSALLVQAGALSQAPPPAIYAAGGHTSPNHHHQLHTYQQQNQHQHQHQHMAERCPQSRPSPQGPHAGYGHGHGSLSSSVGFGAGSAQGGGQHERPLTRGMAGHGTGRMPAMHMPSISESFAPASTAPDSPRSTGRRERGARKRSSGAGQRRNSAQARAPGAMELDTSFIESFLETLSEEDEESTSELRDLQDYLNTVDQVRDRGTRSSGQGLRASGGLGSSSSMNSGPGRPHSTRSSRSGSGRRSGRNRSARGRGSGKGLSSAASSIDGGVVSACAGKGRDTPETKMHRSAAASIAQSMVGLVVDKAVQHSKVEALLKEAELREARAAAAAALDAVSFEGADWQAQAQATLAASGAGGGDAMATLAASGPRFAKPALHPSLNVVLPSQDFRSLLVDPHGASSAMASPRYQQHHGAGVPGAPLGMATGARGGGALLASGVGGMSRYGAHRVR